MSQLRQASSKISDAGGQIVAIGMGDPAQSRRFKQTLRIEFPLLSDTRQTSYSSNDLGRANGVSEFAGNTFGALFREVARGNVGGVPVGDILQLGGTFVVDRDGIIRYLHRSRTTSDNPPVAEIVATLANLSKT